MLERRFGRGAATFARRLVWAWMGAAALTVAPAAGYYEESHVTGDEVRVTVDVAGEARVEHVIDWHVVAGQYRAFDLTGVEQAARPEAQASATSEDGRVLPATLVPREGAGLRVVFEEPKGVKHGRYKIRLAYAVDLVATRAFTRDGTMWRLTWQGPSFPDGYDGARVTFAIPASVDEPRLAEPSSADAVDPGVLASLRRGAERDELQLVKPHVARREVVSWSLRVAPHAFPAVRDLALRPPPPPARPRASDEGPPPLLLLGAAFASALAYTFLVFAKSARFDRECRRFGVRARSLVGLPDDLRAAAAGATFGAGVLLEAAGLPTVGAAGVAAAMLLAVHRPPNAEPAPRGPGSWLALRPDDAFERRLALDPFDPLTRGGAAVALMVLGGLALLGFALARVSPLAPYLVGLDAVPLLPLVATGRRSQLPPDARAGAAWLRVLFRRLARQKSLRVVPWGRVPQGCAEPDELRVRVIPRPAIPGLLGVEVGLSYRRFATAFAASPAVLVRVKGSSSAAARMVALAPFARPAPGRTPEERVFSLRPRLPTRDGTLALVRRLGRELTDRRGVASPWDKPERRVVPADGPTAMPHAA